MKNKTILDDLALFGSAPFFAQPRHVNAPNIAPREAFDRYFDAAWNGRWFTNDGPLMCQFEECLRKFLGVENCVLTCNGTAAMELTVRALGLTGEVILPSYTFVSTANLLRLGGLTPVFCDIDPATMNIDTDACAALITPQTSAVIATHTWSKPCDTDRLQAICDDAGVALVYDAAHAFGAEHQGRRIGGFGRAEIFSLHATKVLHSFEGGLVATNDDDLAAELRLARNFGFTGLDRVDVLGTNAKMSEAHAAMGLANLDVIDTTIEANRRCHDAYAIGLADVPGLHLRRPDLGEVANWHYVVAEVDEATFGLSRDVLADMLTAENVLARRYFYPGCHRMKPHRQEPPLALSETERVCSRVLVLPAGAVITSKDVAAICDLIRFVADSASAINGRLLETNRSPASVSWE